MKLSTETSLSVSGIDNIMGSLSLTGSQNPMDLD
jgi:hypothetical protein